MHPRGGAPHPRPSLCREVAQEEPRGKGVSAQSPVAGPAAHPTSKWSGVGGPGPTPRSPVGRGEATEEDARDGIWAQRQGAWLQLLPVPSQRVDVGVVLSIFLSEFFI